MPDILFVCTGNVFRSLSAEFALRAVLPEGHDITASSAGIRTYPAHPIHGDVRERVRQWGMDADTHTPRQLTREILDSADLVVAMGTDHRDYIRDTFNKTVPLYREILEGVSEGVPDNWEAVADYKTNIDANRAYIHGVVDMMFTNAAQFANNVQAWLPRKPSPRPSAPSLN